MVRSQISRECPQHTVGGKVTDSSVILPLSLCLQATDFGTFMYPSKEEFEHILRTCNLDRVLDEHLFSGLPFSFSESPEIYDQMLRTISRGLRVQQEDICVIGSARVGFSLAPHKFGTPFGQSSDVDIIVVSSALFDLSWEDIITNRRVRWASLREQTRRSLKEHRELHHIYNGWIYPDSLAEALEIGRPWMTTFNGLSQIPDLSSRRIGGRLYRTWQHARVYHRWGLRQIQKKFTTPTETE